MGTLNITRQNLRQRFDALDTSIAGVSDMITNAAMLKPPVLINGRMVTASVAVGSATLASMSAIGKAELSGALTANTWKTVVDITAGAGVVKLANVWQQDTTARSLGIQITIDGVVAYTNYIVPAPTTAHGINAIGATLGAATWDLERIPFNTSFKMEIKSSLSETDKLAWMAIYDLT